MKTDDDTPFSYPVKVGHISANPVEVTISADAEECAGLAKLWSVLEVKALSATFQLQRWKRDGVRLKGRVTADVVQACVVTLEPVQAHIDEPVEVELRRVQRQLARGRGLLAAHRLGLRGGVQVERAAGGLSQRADPADRGLEVLAHGLTLSLRERSIDKRRMPSLTSK